ncbi:MAG: hypothetical protein ABIK31_02920 [candidate division WOR-3 bacterium]
MLKKFVIIFIIIYARSTFFANGLGDIPEQHLSETKNIQSIEIQDTTQSPADSIATTTVESLLSHENVFQDSISEIKITNVFYDTELTEVLKDLSAQTGIMILTDGSVYGSVSIELNDLPFEECLKRILFPLGYSYKKIDDYYLVGANKSENASYHLLTSTEAIKLNYLKAKDAYQLIADVYRPYVKVNPDINLMTITAPNQIIEKFKIDLANIDKPPKQIQIEAIISEVSTDALRELGIKWSGMLSKGSDTINVFADFTKLLETSTELVYKTFTKTISGDWSYTFLLPALQILAQSGKAEIKANPKIITLEGQKASINVGKEQYYQIVSGQPQYPYIRFEVVKYGTSLNITPIISENDEITVEVEPEVSDFVGDGLTGLPIVSRRTVKTQIRVKDGDNIIIGGLKAKTERSVRKKIPILGDIPLLGIFFRYNRKVIDKSDIIIIITPKLLK